MARQISWPYIAGFFDGEGCISTRFSNIRKTPNLRASVSQRADKQIVLQDIQGFLAKKEIKSYLRVRPSYKGQYPVAHLEINGRLNVVPFLKNLLPYLRVKGAKAQETLRLVSQCPWRLFYLTDSEKSQIWKMHSSGLSATEIVKKTSRSPMTIRRVLQGPAIDIGSEQETMFH